MKKKIYIAGKVTGLPFREVAIKFCNAQNEILNLGFEAVNPVELVQDLLIENKEVRYGSEGEIWTFAMKHCIKALLDCDAVYLLPCWQESQGAKIERKLALDLGIKIVTEYQEIQEYAQVNWNI